MESLAFFFLQIVKLNLPFKETFRHLCQIPPFPRHWLLSHSGQVWIKLKPSLSSTCMAGTRHVKHHPVPSQGAGWELTLIPGGIQKVVYWPLTAFLTGQLRALYCSWLPGLSVLPRSLSSSEKNLGLEVYLFIFFPFLACHS